MTKYLWLLAFALVTFIAIATPDFFEKLNRIAEGAGLVVVVRQLLK